MADRDITGFDAIDAIAEGDAWPIGDVSAPTEKSKKATTAQVRTILGCITTGDADQYDTVAEKASPVGDDRLLIEDSAAGLAKKYVKISGLPTSALDINALTEKTSIANADLLLIEDSAAGYAKKKVQKVNLVGGSGGGNTGIHCLGDTGYTTLAAAKTTIGTNHVTLIIPAGTYNVTVDPDYPSNIELLLLKGAIFNISAGITMTINGPIRAGNNRHFVFGSASSRVALGIKEVNAVWFTNGGDGTSSTPWTGASGKAGIGEAIDYVYQPAGPTTGLTIHLPAGYFTVTATIDVKYNGINISGQGSRNHNAGGTTNIWFTPSANDIMFLFKNTHESYILYGCSLRNVVLRNSDPAKANTAIYLADVSGNTFRDITLPHGGTSEWGNSYGISTHGRDMTIFERLYFDSVKWPIYIGQYEGWSGLNYDMDAFIFRDCWLYCSIETGTSACVTIADGVEITESGFKGWTSFSGGAYGLYWNDTSSTRESHGFYLDNIKSEGGAAPGWTVYINRVWPLDNVQIKNMNDQARAGGGIYLRGCRNVTLDNILFWTGLGSGTSINAANIENLNIRNLLTDRPTSLTGMYAGILITTSQGIALASYTDSAPTVSHL